MSQNHLYELAIAYAGSINAIISLFCLLIANRCGALQSF